LNQLIEFHEYSHEPHATGWQVPTTTTQKAPQVGDLEGIWNIIKEFGCFFVRLEFFYRWFVFM